MAQAYDAEGMEQRAVFELFFRRMPAGRRFLVAAGLDDVLDALEAFRFTDADLEYLRGQTIFTDRFLQRLRTLRFTGDVHAMPEGTVVFANEPLVRVEAPIIEAQLVETMVLNQVHFQSLAAAKAARVMIAAAGRDVVEFGARRAHGVDAALKIARASSLGGALGGAASGRQAGQAGGSRLERPPRIGPRPGSPARWSPATSSGGAGPPPTRLILPIPVGPAMW